MSAKEDPLTIDVSSWEHIICPDPNDRAEGLAMCKIALFNMQAEHQKYNFVKDIYDYADPSNSVIIFEYRKAVEALDKAKEKYNTLCHYYGFNPNMLIPDS